MRTHSIRSDVSRAGLSAAAVAAGVNVGIFALARSAEVTLSVASGSSVSRIGLAQIVTASVVPILAATAAATLAGTARRLRWLEAAAVIVTVASLGGPLSMGVGTATKLTLATMHVVAGASFVGFVHRDARRQLHAPAQPADAGPVLEPVA